MKTYRQLRRRKEWHCIKAIGERLDEKDLLKHNPDFKGFCGFETGWLKKTYWHDKWYLFDLLDWVRNKRYTL